MTESAAVHCRYDALLAAVAVALAVGGLVGFAFAIPVAVGLAIGSVPATGLVGYALFVDPPRE
ncbi:hypothetical protein ACFQPA_00210 [Halomarina halobia]|uniref:Uncharacterized protein n=1 Tax=Halomarina halobia TaxID=3033386 RepID=A0ABD6A903_9EURY|nr:hypothetical protein [Halomarina sp. PSR21]